MNPMRIIFNGDDFGLSHGINRGIMDCLAHGLLTSTSIAACGAAAAEAMEFLRECHGCDHGVHLVLSDESPLLSRGQISSLPFRGCRLASRRALTAALFAGKIRFDQVEAEWRTQIERVLASGLSPSHLDSHQFVHLLPGLYRLCLKLAEDYRIRHVRRRVWDIPTLEAGTGRLLQYLALKGWSSFYPAFFPGNDAAHVVTAGFLRAGGRWSRTGVLASMDRLQRRRTDVVLEIMLHPGYAEASVPEHYRHWGYRWEEDLELLTDPWLASGIEARNAELISFRDL